MSISAYIVLNLFVIGTNFYVNKHFYIKAIKNIQFRKGMALGLLFNVLFYVVLGVVLEWHALLLVWCLIGFVSGMYMNVKAYHINKAMGLL